MGALLRNTVLIMFAWLMLAGVCLGKQVYLKDDGIIEGQSAWRRGDKVYVKVNRDIIADFNLSEVDLARTFPETRKKPHHVRHKKPAAAAPHRVAATPAVKAATAPAQVTSPASVPAVTQPPAATPAANPLPAPAPIPPPAANEAVQSGQAQSAPADSSIPPDKAELERRKQEAVKMMTEAIMKKDSELMKKALEMQKSVMPQQGAEALKNAGFPLSILLISLAVCLLIVVAHWIIFERAGQAGWKSLIPFYNMYLLMEIAGKPGWWMFLLLVPLVNVAILLLAMLSLAKRFGKSELFGVGIFLLPMVFLPLLAFGGSKYEG